MVIIIESVSAEQKRLGGCGATTSALLWRERQRFVDEHDTGDFSRHFLAADRFQFNPQSPEKTKNLREKSLRLPRLRVQ